MTRYDEIKQELRRSPRTWLVTGVAGFIGSNLLETLLDLGQNVVGLDNFSSGYRRNLQQVMQEREDRNFRLIEGDICDLETCRKACAGVDYVLHQGAIGSVPRSMEDPALVNLVNVSGTLNVLIAARDARAARMVYASSSAVFGDSRTQPLKEEALGTLLSPYAVSKLTDEHYAEVFGQAYGFEAIGLRYFNVFGPRQDPRGSYAAVIPQWIQAMQEGEACRIHGDGETTRDFVSVRDVVQANILSATVALAPDAPRVFNVGAGRATSLNQLQQMLSESFAELRPEEPGFEPIHGSFREGDIRHSQADITRIQKTLGYVAQGDLAPALHATMAWYFSSLGSAQVAARSA